MTRPTRPLTVTLDPAHLEQWADSLDTALQELEVLTNSFSDGPIRGVLVGVTMRLNALRYEIEAAMPADPGGPREATP